MRAYGISRDIVEQEKNYIGQLQFHLLSLIEEMASAWIEDLEQLTSLVENVLEIFLFLFSFLYLLLFLDYEIIRFLRM
jgi:hypothetical protein